MKYLPLTRRLKADRARSRHDSKLRPGTAGFRRGVSRVPGPLCLRQNPVELGDRIHDPRSRIGSSKESPSTPPMATNAWRPIFSCHGLLTPVSNGRSFSRCGIASSIRDRLVAMPRIDFILKSGRAVLWPIYKGTYERQDGVPTYFPNTSIRYRDRVIQWAKDLRRSIDYLETRAEIDMKKLAFYGFSWGACMGAIMPAVEDRLSVSVLMGPVFISNRRAPRSIRSISRRG